MYLESQKTYCPHCGERIELVLDNSADQEYIEDCQVCCQPIMVTVLTTGESVELSVSADI